MIQNKQDNESYFDFAKRLAREIKDNVGEPKIEISDEDSRLLNKTPGIPADIAGDKLFEKLTGPKLTLIKGGKDESVS